jgi:glycosyltransferase involved in cell wall biosynthesis
MSVDVQAADTGSKTGTAKLPIGGRMNVCMLAYAHYINDARIKNYVRTLEDHGHQVDVIALRCDGEAAVEKRGSGTTFRIMEKYQGDSTLMYVWSYLKFFLKSAFFLTRRSFGHRYQVVHVHNMPNALVFAALVPKLLGAKIMLDVHDLMMVNYMAKFDVTENALPVKILRLEQGISALLANRVFCADHNQGDYLVQHCGVAAKKITVLLNLPNIELFRPVTNPKKTGAFRIVYHGTIAHRLGIDLILRAVAKAVTRVPVELWVYGAGDYLPDALALLSELGLEGKAHFSGTFFPVEKIPEMVCGMDLGIIGNRHNLACDKYMLPVKLLEYVYLGVPVVAPRLEVISYYFDDTMLRFYEAENVDAMADAIVELFNNRDQRERQAAAASRFYQKYSPQAQADRYLQLMTGPDSGLPQRAEHHA